MKWFKLIDFERAAALVTWLCVSMSAAYFGIRQYGADHWRVWLSLLLFVSIAAGFVCLTKQTDKQNSRKVALLFAQYLLSIACFWVLPFNYLAIFVVIWSAIMPYYLSWQRAVLLSPLLALPLALSMTFYWQQQGGWLTALLFWTFNLFAMMMSRAAIRETHAREKADQLNRELVSAQQLLRQASQQDERLRIARNIHDLLGHHLTALSINLQVAAHKSEGEALDSIQRCHALSRLLLSDVRDAVADMRENACLNWSAAVSALFNLLPSPRLKLDVATDVKITDIYMAETLLYCVQEALTNTLRHTNATEFSVTLQRNPGQLSLKIHDNGGAPKAVRHGHGLTGMQERITAMGGRMHTHCCADGLMLCLQIPERD